MLTFPHLEPYRRLRMKKAMSKLFGKMAGKSPAIPPKASDGMRRTLASLLKTGAMNKKTKQPINMLKG